MPTNGAPADQRADAAHAGARVEDQAGDLRVVMGDRDAGGVPAVAQEVGARRGCGAPHPAEVNAHCCSAPRRSSRGDDPWRARAALARSSWSASHRSDPQVVTATRVDVRLPPSRCARSPSSAPGPYSASRSPSCSTRSTPSSSRKTSEPSSPCLTSSLPAFTRLIFGLSPPAHHLLGERALQRSLDRGDERLGLLVAPRGVTAEGLAIPVLEVRQPRLVRVLAGVVVDPVARETACALHLALGATVGVNRERERRPDERRLPLHERLAAHAARRRHARAPAVGLHEAHEVLARLRACAGYRAARPPRTSSRAGRPSRSCCPSARRRCSRSR